LESIGKKVKVVNRTAYGYEIKALLLKINRFFELESLPERKSDSVLGVLKPIP